MNRTAVSALLLATLLLAGCGSSSEDESAYNFSDYEPTELAPAEPDVAEEAPEPEPDPDPGSVSCEEYLEMGSSAKRDYAVEKLIERFGSRPGSMDVINVATGLSSGCEATPAASADTLVAMAISRNVG